MHPNVVAHTSVFMPHAMRRLEELHKSKTRFVHYTSAEVGLEILRTNTMWLRQAANMNDYSEIEHGLRCIASAWRSDHGIRLQKILDGRFPGIVQEIQASFDSAQNDLRYGTYVLSLSEHAGRDREDEDLHGRLSMWRAYARGVGVALVIKQDFIWTTDTSLGLFTTPIAYLSDEDFAKEFAVVVSNIEANSAYLDILGRNGVRNSLFNTFAAAAISTKHPGFREELEWRIVRSPTFPFQCPLEKITKAINGIPQQILLLKLKDNPGGLVGIEPRALVDRVIIGPTAYPVTIYNAYMEQMKASGFEKPEDKLRISFIPLRASSA